MAMEGTNWRWRLEKLERESDAALKAMIACKYEDLHK